MKRRQNIEAPPPVVAISFQVHEVEAMHWINLLVRSGMQVAVLPQQGAILERVDRLTGQVTPDPHARQVMKRRPAAEAPHNSKAAGRAPKPRQTKFRDLGKGRLEDRLADLLRERRRMRADALEAQAREWGYKRNSMGPALFRARKDHPEIVRVGHGEWEWRERSEKAG